VLAEEKVGNRKALRNTLLVFALCVAVWLASAAFQARAAEIVKGIAALLAGLALIRLLGLALFRFALPAAGARTPRIAEDVVLVLGYVGWGALQLRLAGMDLASLVTTSAVITAVVAFAMQDTLGNTLGGLFLEIDQSIAIGDWIKLDDLSGRVAEIRWRHTAVRTRNGDLVIIPNSALMKSRFSVIGNPDEEEVRWRRWIWFDVDFDVAAPKVIAAAEQALSGAEIENVAREPRPDCALMELALGQGRYALRYWLTDPRRDDGTDSAVRVHLLAALERSGISPSLPKQVTHEVKETEERQLARRARDIEARMAALRGVDLFAALSPEELRALAMHLVHAPFADGDVITRQGAVAHWLYILLEGEAEVWVDAAGAPRRRVAALGPGSVFGEMGMMTGEPRRATVIAKGGAECYRLDKPGFEEILRARPQIAESMSRVLAARAIGLRHVVEESEAAAAAAGLQPESLLARIRAFFGIDAGNPGSRRAA
jgi:small-conductance mechanosensitive channel